MVSVKKNRTPPPHKFCHGYSKASRREKKNHTVTATIHFEPAGCKKEVPNPFAKICESCVRVSCAVGILHQHDGWARGTLSQSDAPATRALSRWGGGGYRLQNAYAPAPCLLPIGRSESTVLK
jgi:hypothetical protein